MTTIDELRARVAERYVDLQMPDWPDPHPGLSRRPGEEEYSRVTDGGRYKIGPARAQLWAEVLQDALDVENQVLPVPVEHPLLYDRGMVLTCSRPHTLPLFLLEADLDDAMSLVQVSVFAPDLVVERQPGCGCDACDDGSAALLEAVDDAIAAVVSGDYVVMRGREWVSHWHPQAGSCTGSPEADGLSFDQAMQLSQQLAADPCAPVPEGVEVFVGRSWLSAERSGRSRNSPRPN